MLKILLPATLFLITVEAGAQNYSIQLQSGSFTPEKMVVAGSDRELIAGRYYRILQFSKMPADEERLKLEKKGIRLLEYIPNNAFIVSIAQGTPDIVLRDPSIRAVFPMSAQNKLNDLLAKGQYPEWAKRGKGNIELTLQYHKDITHEMAAQLLAGNYVTVVANMPEQNAFRINVPVSQIRKIAALPWVSFMEPADAEPVRENLAGRTNHRSNTIAADYPAGLHFDGTGVRVALNDDGVIGPHIDYKGRIVNQYITFNNGNHGDHCAGIIFGAGNKNPVARGMAFGAELGVYGVSSSFNSYYQAFDSISLHYQTQGIRITSTSYGDGNNTGYTTRARMMDQQIRNMPELMHVFSAGNSGTSNFNYGAGAGWGNITGGHKQAKNVITVGNVFYYDSLATSSSRGPAKDGRLKPDVCAVGTNVLSTISQHEYDSYTGTSMACPGVAGTLAQLYHAYKTMNNGDNPPSALVKAAVLNTADDLGNPGPDYKHGWGRINARRAFGVLAGGQYLTDSVSQAGTKSHTVAVSSNVAELRIMLYWHDKEASAGASKALVNNLDLTVTDPASQTILPWVLNKTPTVAALSANAFQGVDTLNNAEQVTVASPAQGSYTVQVTGTSVPFGPQSYVVVYEFVYDSLKLTYPIGGESIVPGIQETIRWDAVGSNGIFTLEYSTDSGSNWTTISSNVAANRRYYNWTPPSVVSGKALVRINRGSQSDVSDAAFSIIGVPAGVSIDWVCTDSLKVNYSTVTGATGYIITALGMKYMDSVGFSNTGSCVVYMNTATAGWISVQAVGPDNCTGRRALAIPYLAAPFNCVQPEDLAAGAMVLPDNASELTCQGSGVQDTVSFRIRNNSNVSIGNFPVYYSINGVLAASSNYTGSIPPGDSALFTFSQLANLNFSGLNTIKAWADHGPDNISWNDTATIEKTVLIPNLSALPLIEDFETFTLCDTFANCELQICSLHNGWSNMVNGIDDDIDWRVHSGPTPSRIATGVTGPTSDHNPGTPSGRYLYLEGTNCPDQTAMLISPCIDLTGVPYPRLSFACHMFGANTGNLHVDVLTSGSWTEDIQGTVITGNTADQWLVFDQNLAPFSGSVINLRFRAETGSLDGDIALDNIRVENVPPVSGTYDPDRLHAAVFPNPSAGLYTVLAAKAAKGTVLTVSDLSGRVLHKLEGVFDGNATVILDLTGFPSGMYLLTLKDNNKTYNTKLTRL